MCIDSLYADESLFGAKIAAVLTHVLNRIVRPDKGLQSWQPASTKTRTTYSIQIRVSEKSYPAARRASTRRSHHLTRGMPHKLKMLSETRHAVNVSAAGLWIRWLIAGSFGSQQISERIANGSPFRRCASIFTLSLLAIGFAVLAKLLEQVKGSFDTIVGLTAR